MQFLNIIAGIVLILQVRGIELDRTQFNWQLFKSHINPYGQQDTCGAALNDKIYIYGGWNQEFTNITSYFNILYVFDPSSDTIVELNSRINATLPILIGCGMSAIDNRIFITGGTDDNAVSYNDTYWYDPADDSWTLGAPMLRSASWHSQIVLNNMLYLFFGWTSYQYPLTPCFNDLLGCYDTNWVQIYDIANESWTLVTKESQGSPSSWPGAREGPSVGATSMSGTDVVFIQGGGCFGCSKASGDVYYKEIYLFFPSNLTFATFTKGNQPFRAFASFNYYLGYFFLVAGGYSDSVGSVFKFNDITSVTTDLVNWTLITPANTPPSVRWSIPSVVIENQTDDINGMYIIGGADNAASFQDIYRIYATTIPDVTTSALVDVTTSALEVTTSTDPSNIESSGSSSNTTVIVAIVVPIAIVVLVLIVGLIAYLHYKRQNRLQEVDIELKKPKHSDPLVRNFSNRTLTAHMKENLVAKTPAEMEIALSNTSLSFGVGDEVKLEIGKAYTDSFTISNQSARSTAKGMDVRLYYPDHNHKFTMECKYDNEHKIKSGKSMTVHVTLTVHCTTTFEIFIGVAVDDVGYTKVLINKTSGLSTYLDYEDIKLENDPIGEGAYSKVFSGMWRGTEVAVKLLKNQHLTELERQDFERETSMMNSLRHPNILNFIGSVNAVGHLCFVTELIKLGSLDSVMKRHQVGLKLKCRFIVDMAKAMTFLHSAGILHRDLKPENFLVVSLSSRAEVNIKLADFGTSRAVSLLKEKHYTKAIGTPIYMSPEVLNNEEYNTPADVYSFAILLLKVMTEEDPYKDMAYAWDVAAFVTAGNRPAVPNFIPDKLAKLIMKCWHQNPKERPSFEEIYRIAKEAQEEVEAAKRTPRSSSKYDVAEEESEGEIEVDLPDW